MDDANIVVDKIFNFLANKSKEQRLFGHVIYELKIDAYGDNEPLMHEIISILNQANGMGLFEEFSGKDTGDGIIQLNKFGGNVITAYGSYSKYLQHLVSEQKERKRVEGLNIKKLEIDIKMSERVIRDYPTTEFRANMGVYLATAALLVPVLIWLWQLLNYSYALLSSIHP